MIKQQQMVGSSLYILNKMQFYKVDKGLKFCVVYVTVPTKSCNWERDSPQVLAQRTTVLGLFTDNMTPIHMAAGQFPPLPPFTQLPPPRRGLWSQTVWLWLSSMMLWDTFKDSCFNGLSIKVLKFLSYSMTNWWSIVSMISKEWKANFELPSKLIIKRLKT